MKSNGKFGFCGDNVGELNEYKCTVKILDFVLVQFCILATQGGCLLNWIFAIFSDKELI